MYLAYATVTYRNCSSFCSRCFTWSVLSGTCRRAFEKQSRLMKDDERKRACLDVWAARQRTGRSERREKNQQFLWTLPSNMLFASFFHQHLFASIFHPIRFFAFYLFLLIVFYFPLLVQFPLRFQALLFGRGASNAPVPANGPRMVRLETGGVTWLCFPGLRVSPSDFSSLFFVNSLRWQWKKNSLVHTWYRLIILDRIPSQLRGCRRMASSGRGPSGAISRRRGQSARAEMDGKWVTDRWSEWYPHMWHMRCCQSHCRKEVSDKCYMVTADFG